MTQPQLVNPASEVMTIGACVRAAAVASGAVHTSMTNRNRQPDAIRRAITNLLRVACPALLERAEESTPGPSKTAATWPIGCPALTRCRVAWELTYPQLTT